MAEQIMAFNSEKRNKARVNYQCPVTIEDLQIGRIYRAQMLNCSENGLYFEVDKLLQPGEGVFIGIEDSPIASLADTYKCYRAKIIWRKKLTTSSFYYGYGVKYTVDYNKLYLQVDVEKELKDIRRYVRKPYSRPVFFITKNRRYGGFIKNISPAGAFIKTHESLGSGKVLTLGIPFKKDKKAKVKGKVVWSNPEGFAIKFLRTQKQLPLI
jgi:Tfp pilus assembly protein PilZ